MSPKKLGSTLGPASARELSSSYPTHGSNLSSKEGTAGQTIDRRQSVPDGVFGDGFWRNKSDLLSNLENKWKEDRKENVHKISGTVRS